MPRGLNHPWPAPILCTSFYVSPNAAAVVSGDPRLGTRYASGAGGLFLSELCGRLRLHWFLQPPISTWASRSV